MDELITRIRSGDEQAFAELVHVYYQGLFDFAFHYTRSVPAAEDVIQDVLLNIWEHRREWAAKQSIKAYLYGAVRNRALNYLRSRKETVEPGMDFIGASDRPDEAFGMSELADAYRRAVAELPERRREIFRMSRLYGLTYEEIGEALNISINTVRSQMSAAIAHLRARLAEHL